MGERGVVGQVGGVEFEDDVLGEAHVVVGVLGGSAQGNEAADKR